MSKEQITKITYQLDVESEDVEKAIDNVKRLEKEIKSVNKASILVNRDARTSLVNERKKYYRDENRRKEELHVSKEKYWREKANHEKWNTKIKERRVDVADERNRLKQLELKLMQEGKYVGPVKKGAGTKDKAGRGSRRPFESMMMAIGSFMLLQYAAQMPVMWAGALGDAMASVETDTRKGRAYRQSLINKGASTKNFDKAVSRYSEISGEQGYMARKRIASMYGALGQRNVNAGSLNPEQLAMVMQGLTVGMGMSDEQADKKLVELLSGKISKEDKKTFGIKSRTPVQILEEINNSLQKNPVTASVMTGDSAVAHMKFIRGAKNEMLSRIDDLWGNLFTSITKPMKEFAKTFFGLDNEKVLGEWITTFATIRDQIEDVFTKKNAEKLAIFVNNTLSTLTMLIGGIGEFVFDHPWISSILGFGGLFLKSKTGSIWGNIGKHLFGDEEGDQKGQKVFVTNMPKGIGSKINYGGDMIAKGIATGIKRFGPYVALAIAGALVGYFGGKFIRDRWNREEKVSALDQKMIKYGLKWEHRDEFIKAYRSGQHIDFGEFIRQHATEEKYKQYLKDEQEFIEGRKKFEEMRKKNKHADPTEVFTRDMALEIQRAAQDMGLESFPVGENGSQKGQVHIVATNVNFNGKNMDTDLRINDQYIGYELI